MAHRALPLSVRAAGWAAAAFTATLVTGTLLAVALRAEAPARLGPADWAAVRFTLLQALASAALSCAAAVPVARALARRRFTGRAVLVTLLGAPFLMPSIVAVIGLLAVWGRSGWLSSLAAQAGLPPLDVYGPLGVVLAHVFLNLPLATRLLLQGWLSIPSERFRLAASLGLPPTEIARLLERPMLREVIPGTFAAIFLVCLGSFAVALTLGGGPRATTVELAIYQAFRFEFDLGRAALLGLVQLALTLTAATLALRLALPAGLGAGLDRSVERWDATRPGLRALDAVLIASATAFLVAPLAAIALRGAPALVAGLPPEVWAAVLRSLAVALASAALALFLALPLALLSTAPRGGRLAEAAGFLTLAASPLVLGTGLFLILNPFASPAALALPVTSLVNAAMALPFALRALIPALRQAEAGHGRLADSLGLIGGARLRLLLLPRSTRALGFSAGLAAAFSMGDLGVITLFSDGANATLPLALFRLMGAYRMDEAAGAALLLMALCLALFWVFDRGGRLGERT